MTSSLLATTMLSLRWCLIEFRTWACFEWNPVHSPFCALVCGTTLPPSMLMGFLVGEIKSKLCSRNAFQKERSSLQDQTRASLVNTNTCLKDVEGVPQQPLILQKPPWGGHPLLITSSFTPQHWLCWSPEQTAWSARHLLTICPPAGQQVLGNPRWTASFTPGKISRQNKAPYPLDLKHHHNSFFILPCDEEKEILPSDHHHPHPRGRKMKMQAINTGEAQLIYFRLLSFHTWLECLGNTESPWQVTSLKLYPLTPLSQGP